MENPVAPLESWLRSREHVPVEVYADSDNVSHAVAHEIAALIRQKAQQGRFASFIAAPPSFPPSSAISPQRAWRWCQLLLRGFELLIWSRRPIQDPALCISTNTFSIPLPSSPNSTLNLHPLRPPCLAGSPCVLGLATGSTPMHVYRELVRLHKEEGLSFANVVTFNLDEYYPMQPAALQSYRRFMFEHLFDHVDIIQSNIHIPDGSLPRADVSKWAVPKSTWPGMRVGDRVRVGVGDYQWGWIFRRGYFQLL